MWICLALVLFAWQPPDPPASGAGLLPDGSAALADSIAARYGRKDTAGLARLRPAARTPGDDLLLRYRLYPLTQDRALLDELPPDGACRSARDHALLSALLSFRIAGSSPLRVISTARRSDALLARAQEIDAGDPFVLLVTGQNLLFRPALFGGSASRALEQFVRLRDLLRVREAAGRPVPGLTAMEAEVWTWYTLRRMDHSGTDALRDRLLAANPPPVFREFLLDPP